MKNLRLALITLMIALMLPLAGCKTDIDKNILIIGDSLTQQCVGLLGFKLLTDPDHGYFIMDNAIAGSSFSKPDITGTLYWHDRLEAIFPQHAVDAIVVSLGTNDTGQTISIADRAAAIDLLMSATHGVPVYWVLPNNRVAEVAPTTIDDVRNTIVSAVARWPNLHVLSIDWYLGAQGIALDDVSELYPSVHYNEAGIDQWANMVASALLIH